MPDMVGSNSYQLEQFINPQIPEMRAAAIRNTVCLWVCVFEVTVVTESEASQIEISDFSFEARNVC